MRFMASVSWFDHYDGTVSIQVQVEAEKKADITADMLITAALATSHRFFKANMSNFKVHAIRPADDLHPSLAGIYVGEQ